VREAQGVVDSLSQAHSMLEPQCGDQRIDVGVRAIKARSDSDNWSFGDARTPNSVDIVLLEQPALDALSVRIRLHPL
jgi:hypothetical protein